MSVLHVMQCTNLGGMEQVAFRCMEGLSRGGLRFRIATPRPFGPGWPRVREFDPKARDFPYRGRFGWRDFLSLRRHVHALAEDCDQVWVTGTCLAALGAVKGVGRPTVLSHHYHHFEDRLSWYKWRAFYELACRGLDAITYPTVFTRDEAVRIAPWLADRAVVVPNGYEIHYADEAERRAARAAARRRLNIPDDAFVVGNAGWLIARKRFDVFLAVAAQIARTVPDARFVICGDGPLRGALQAQARSLGIFGRVRFTGWVRDLADYYRAWDVLLFNSDFDTLPCAPMEAASYGCPTVASLLYGALGEFIEHGRNGFLFPTHDTWELAEAAASLACNAALADQVRTAARHTLATRFSPDAALDFYRKFFGVAADARAVV